MNAPLPIGSNFRGFSVPEASASAAAADPIMPVVGQLVQQDETRRKAAQFQQLLQKGVDGAQMYVQDVAQMNPTLGTKFAGELQTVAPILQSMTPDKAGAAVLGLFESWNGQWEALMKPGPKAEPTLEEKLAYNIKLNEDKLAKDKDLAKYKAGLKPGKGQGDKAKGAKVLTNAIWERIIKKMNEQTALVDDPEKQASTSKELEALYKELNAAEADAEEPLFYVGRVNPKDHPSYIRYKSTMDALKIPTSMPEVTPTQVGTAPSASQGLNVPEETLAKLPPDRQAKLKGAIAALAEMEADPKADTNKTGRLRQAILQDLAQSALVVTPR